MDKAALLTLLQAPYSRAGFQSLLEALFPGHATYAPSVDARRETAAENKLVAELWQLGEAPLGEDNVALYEVRLQPGVRISHNRRGLRDLVRQHIIPGMTDAALVAFYQPDVEAWRLSLVSRSYNMETGRIEEATTPRRYTYLLGPLEKVRTPRDRIHHLMHQPHRSLQHLLEAFSVETLGDDFFHRYTVAYQAFVDHLMVHALDDPAFGGEDKAVRNWVKKMMGRVVFLYFLQKKHWLGAAPDRWEGGSPTFLKDLFDKAQEQESTEVFYAEVLFPLFFETLNQPGNGKNFEALGQDWGRIPYLNGGLFEVAPNEPRTLPLPAELFQKLFETLEAYNFTIVEDDPYEREVAVDPEILGHIFENLLEDNHDKGTYYTPKDIVEYMCQEALTEYLVGVLDRQGHTRADGGSTREAIQQLLRHQDETNLGRLDVSVLTALHAVTICDPAIGSGAFPMGMLHEIFKAVETLWHLTPDATAQAWGISATNWQPAPVKLAIIQQSLYGVDLEMGAVDIARLRFWLSIVVDEPEPQPLPNLDYHIMQGDSLLESYGSIPLKTLNEQYREAGLQGSLFGVVEQTRSVSEMMDEYFTATPTRKIALRLEIDDFVQKALRKELDALRRGHKKVIKEQQNIVRLNEVALPKAKNKTQANKIEKQLKKAQKALAQATEALQQLEEQIDHLLTMFTQGGEKPFFLWHLWFGDILTPKEKTKQGPGFDIVIGNPPYIQLQKHPQASAYAEEKYSTYDRTGDIYGLFYELGGRLLKPHGTLCYITSNKWMRSGYGAPLRQYFAKEVQTLGVIDFGMSQLFSNATTYTNILLFRKLAENTGGWACRIPDAAPRTQLRSLLAEHERHMPQWEEKSWVLLPTPLALLKEEAAAQGEPLESSDWEIKINYGIKTGFNPAFIIDEETKDRLITEDAKSAELLFPMLRGKDIVAYYPNYEDFWLIFTRRGCHIDSYPAVKRHLEKYREDLEPKQSKDDEKGRKPGPYEWYEIQDSIAYWKDFSKPKIIYPNMTKHLPFMLDREDHFFCNDKAFILTGKHLEYLTVVLNSSLFKALFKDEFPELMGNTYEVRKVFFEKIPIKLPEDFSEPAFVRLCEYLVAVRKDPELRLSPEVDASMLFPYLQALADAAVWQHYFPEETDAAKASVIGLIHEHFPPLEATEYPAERTAHLTTVHALLTQADGALVQALQQTVATTHAQTMLGYLGQNWVYPAPNEVEA